MTQKEIDEFLANTKVYVNGKSKDIQEKLFSLGYKWYAGELGICHTESPFLFIYKNKFFAHSSNMVHFSAYGCREISAEEILSLEITDDDNNIEGLMQRNIKKYPYKIGDRVVLKGSNRCATITDLKYNSWGNLSYYIKIDNDKDISIDYPTNLLLPYDNKVEGLVEEEDEETNWKPSKEEMDVLYGLAYITNKYDEHKEEVIARLYQDLKREFFNGSSYENMFPNTENDVRRRSTIQVLEYARSLDNYNQYGKADIDKNIAWLERQGKSALEARTDNELIEEEVGLVDKFSSRWVNEFNLPEGYEFKDENGNIINATKIVLEKKKKEYPKTYEECCEMLDIIDNRDTWRGYRSVQLKIFQEILICRDAYWKIAGEEMGLGKPWKPDYDSGVNKYGIICMNGTIQKSNPSTNWERHLNKVFEFPTEEMRDTFYENFKSEIESCNELL